MRIGTGVSGRYLSLSAGTQQPQKLYGGAGGGFGAPQFGGAGPAFGFAPDGSGAACAYGFAGPQGFDSGGFGGIGFSGSGHGAEALQLQADDEDGDEAVDEVDTYAVAGVYVAAAPADLQHQAPFLLQQLAPFAGRHIITVRSCQWLAAVTAIPALLLLTELWLK